MRFIALIYSERQPDPAQRNYTAHRTLIEEATRAGVFVAAEPLAPACMSNTIRSSNGITMITDGPFAETKEQLAGYYIFECTDSEEAVNWASKIPGACTNPVTIEVRPMPGMPAPETDARTEKSASSL